MRVASIESMAWVMDLAVLPNDSLALMCPYSKNVVFVGNDELYYSAIFSSSGENLFTQKDENVKCGLFQIPSSLIHRI